MRALVVLLVLSATLAGCSDEPADQPTQLPPTADECELAGLEFGEDNGTAACVEPTPPATIRIEGAPNSSPAYTVIAMKWVLDTHLEENHAMRTEIRSATSPVPDDALAGPDEYGTSLALKEHQNFVSGQSYDANWNPDTPGTYYLRAYALVQQQDIWSQEVVVRITAPEPTGVTHTITITAGGPILSTADPAELQADIGDAIQFQNDDFADHSLQWTAGPAALADFTVAAGAASEPIVLFAPGSYLYQSGDANPFSGEIRVES